MRELVMRAIMLILVLTFPLGVAEAQLPSYITGEVTSRGERIPGVTIKVDLKQCDCTKCKVACRECCPSSVTGITDNNGIYRIRVGPGQYRVTASMEGMATKSFEVTVDVGSNTRNIDFGSGTGEDITITSAAPVKQLGTASVKVTDARSGKALGKTQLLFVKKACDCSKCPTGAARCSCCPEATAGTTSESGRLSAILAPGKYDVIVATETGDVTAGTVTVKSAAKTTANIRVKDQ
jgi:hypothetical protein